MWQWSTSDANVAATTVFTIDTRRKPGVKTSPAIAAVAASSLNTVEVGNGADADVGIGGGVDVGADIIVDVGASGVSPVSRL